MQISLALVVSGKPACSPPQGRAHSHGRGDAQGLAHASHKFHAPRPTPHLAQPWPVRPRHGAALYLVVHVTAMPYATYSDNFLGMMCSLGMTMFLLAALLLKVDWLVEVPEVAERLSEELAYTHNIDFPALTGVLTACVLCALVVAGAVLNMQFVAEQARLRNEALAAKSRRLRVRPDGTMVHAPPIEQGGYHLFLSHVWGTGQDQMRVIKQQAQQVEMAPSLPF